MTTKRTAGDLTTLWMDNEDAAAEGMVEDDSGTTGPDVLDMLADVTEHVEGRNASRSPRGERRRPDWRRAERQRRAREAALQVLFEVDLVGHDVTDVRERQFDQMLLVDEPRMFAERLVNGVLVEQTGLDTLIASLAPTWPTAQLPRVDINVLRLALYELLAERETPMGAIINEAVELAKQYGSENSGKFVNGVLGTVSARVTAGTMQRSMDMIHIM